jgi:hypothetical protein
MGRVLTGALLESCEARRGLEIEREFRWREPIGRLADLN